ncbi:MAG: hypothetical protein AAF399_27115, partial [Bacteroidota bacterium]
ACITHRFTATAPTKQQGLLPGSSAPNLQFSGQVHVQAQHSNLPNPFSQLPASFARISAQPQLSLWGIPLQSQVFWSTEQRQLNYDLNLVSLNLNHHQLMETLKERLLAQLEEELSGRGPRDSSLWYRLMAVRDADYQEALADLDPRTRQLIDSSYQHLFQTEEKLRRMKQMLEHPQLADVEEVWQEQLATHQVTDSVQQRAFEDSLQFHHPDQYASWMRLKGSYHQLQKLRQKVTELEAQGKRLGSFARFRQKAQELERLRTASPEELLRKPENLRQVGQFGKGLGFLTQLTSFGIGNVVPNQSPLSLQGIALNGLQLGWQGERWYSEVAAGKVRSGPWQLLDTTQQSTSTAWLAAVRVGKGAPSHTHLHALLQSSWEMGANAMGRSQQLAGLSAQALLWRDRWRIQGQFMHSRWENETPTTSYTPDSLPLWGSWGAIPTSRIGSAWSVESELRLFQGKTQLFGKWMEVPENYYSPGAPLLIRGQDAFEVRLRQQLFASRLEISAFGRKNRNELLPVVPTATSAVSMGVDASLRLPKLPFLQLTYAPFYQEQVVQDTLNLTGYQQSLLNAVSGYHAQIGKLSSNTHLIYSLQWGGNQQPEAGFMAHLLSFNQSFQWPSSFAIQTTATYVHADYSLALNETLQWETNVSGTLFRRWNHTLGATLQQQAKQPARFGGYWQQRIQLMQSLSLDLLLRYNPLTTLAGLPLNREERLAQMGVTYQW